MIFFQPCNHQLPLTDKKCTKLLFRWMNYTGWKIAGNWHSWLGDVKGILTVKH